jgi:hypothetical protein
VGEAAVPWPASKMLVYVLHADLHTSIIVFPAPLPPGSPCLLHSPFLDSVVPL